MILWIKALHLILMVCWFAGLFYLPRLFVYHSMTEDETGNNRFKIMERKLYYGIMLPSMILTFIFGIWLLILEPFYLHALWLQIKLGLVGLLLIYHFICSHFVKVFKQNNNRRTHIFYRWFNEFPVMILISVICLAVVRPF